METEITAPYIPWILMKYMPVIINIPVAIIVLYICSRSLPKTFAGWPTPSSFNTENPS